VIGLMRTMQLQGRTEPLRVWGPKGAARILQRAEVFTSERMAYAVTITELDPGAAVQRSGYAIHPFAVSHRGAVALGYALIEDTRLGRFHPERARELGIPEGPLWGQLHRGRPATLPDGRVVDPIDLVGPQRSGRRVIVTGDTRPCEATIEAARGADLLIHEATFAEEEAARAIETGHSTAREAATVAARAGARQLILTHVSARYTRDTSDLDREARAVFANTLIARDGLEVDVPYTES